MSGPARNRLKAHSDGVNCRIARLCLGPKHTSGRSKGLPELEKAPAMPLLMPITSDDKRYEKSQGSSPGR